MEEIFDIEEFTVSFMVENRTFLVDMFLACAYEVLHAEMAKIYKILH